MLQKLRKIIQYSQSERRGEDMLKFFIKLFLLLENCLNQYFQA